MTNLAHSKNDSLLYADITEAREHSETLPHGREANKQV